MKLALGTVQFGLKYGISNKEGKTPFAEASKIIQYARQAGITVLDTAAIYGDSEEIIGRLTGNQDEFKIITKVPSLQNERVGVSKQLDELLNRSLLKLNRKKIYGIMCHNVNDLFTQQGERLYRKLEEFKERGIVEKIGCSVYEQKEIERLLEYYNFDMIQLPINVLDQRLILSGHIQRLHQMGVEIFARSIFLQGLLLMDLKEIPSYFQPIYPKLVQYHQYLRENQMSLLDGALDFIKRFSEIDYYVVGVNNLKQLVEIKNSYEKDIKPNMDYTPFACHLSHIIDPRRWKR